MTSVFGRNSYPSERCEVIWRELESLPDAWFTHVIDEFIGNCAKAPLMPEFREKISEERERLYKIKKAQQTKDAQVFMQKYSGEDIQTICGQIRDSIRGRLSPDESRCLVDMLTPPDRVRCEQCHGTGLSRDKPEDLEAGLIPGNTICPCGSKKI